MDNLDIGKGEEYQGVRAVKRVEGEYGEEIRAHGEGVVYVIEE